MPRAVIHICNSGLKYILEFQIIIYNRHFRSRDYLYWKGAFPPLFLWSVFPVSNHTSLSESFTVCEVVCQVICGPYLISFSAPLLSLLFTFFYSLLYFGLLSLLFHSFKSAAFKLLSFGDPHLDMLSRLIK